MALILQREKKVILRMTYLGIPFSGKSTLLKSLHGLYAENERGELQSGFINSDRCLAFDLLNVPISVIPGFSTSIQISTLPGFTVRTSSYHQLLKMIDGIAYVVDSQWDRMGDNDRALAALQEILIEQKKSLSEIPFVLLYNKRGMTQAAPKSYLEETFNQRSIIASSFEVNSLDGTGVKESLQVIIRKIEARYSQPK